MVRKKCSGDDVVNVEEILMKYYLKGRTLYRRESFSPERPIATFSEELNVSTLREIVNALNKGTEIFNSYKRHRDDLHIVNIVKMLEEMESIFCPLTP